MGDRYASTCRPSAPGFATLARTKGSQRFAKCKRTCQLSPEPGETIAGGRGGRALGQRMERLRRGSGQRLHRDATGHRRTLVPVTGNTGARSHEAHVIDLYLGGDLGSWTLDQVGDTPIRAVFSYDEEILNAARRSSQRTDRDPPDPRDIETGSVAVCIHYPRIFPPDLIDRYQVMYNLHPGYLPWGRGFYPVFWALWEQTPAGATLHEIEPALDKGPIVMQIRVPQYPHDTGGSLHERVRRAEREIFQHMWPKIAAGDQPPTRPTPPVKGTYHSKAEFVALREHAKLESLSGGDLLRLVRALTFPGLPGLQVDLGGQAFHLSLEELEKEPTTEVQGNLQA